MRSMKWAANTGEACSSGIVNCCNSVNDFPKYFTCSILTAAMPNKRIATRFGFFIIALVFSTSCLAQSIDSAAQKYGNTFQPEKAYLHLDKSSYSPGETIWFKAYLM